MYLYIVRAKQRRDNINKCIEAGYNAFSAKGITNDEAKNYDETIRSPMLKYNEGLFNLVIELEQDRNSLFHDNKNLQDDLKQQLSRHKAQLKQLKQLNDELSKAYEALGDCQLKYDQNMIKTVVAHRGTENWQQLADTFCKKVNDSIPAEKILCISATVGHSNSSGILVAYGSETPVHKNRTGKQLTSKIISDPGSWTDFWKILMAQLGKFHPDSIVGLGLAQTPPNTHADCFAIIWILK